MGEISSMPTGNELLPFFHANLAQLPEQWQGKGRAADATEDWIGVCAISGALLKAQEQFEASKLVTIPEQVSEHIYASHTAA